MLSQSFRPRSTSAPLMLSIPLSLVFWRASRPTVTTRATADGGLHYDYHDTHTHKRVVAAFVFVYNYAIVLLPLFFVTFFFFPGNSSSCIWQPFCHFSHSLRPFSCVPLPLPLCLSLSLAVSLLSPIDKKGKKAFHCQSPRVAALSPRPVCNSCPLSLSPLPLPLFPTSSHARVVLFGSCSIKAKICRSAVSK